MEELFNIFGGALYSILGGIFQKVAAFSYRLIAARIGKEEYGLLSLGLIIFGMINVLSLLGINVGLIRFLSYYRGKKDQSKMRRITSSAIKISLFLGLGCGFLFYLSSNIISRLIFHNDKLIPILKIFSLGIPFWALAEILLCVPVAMQNIKYYIFTRDVTESLLKVGLALILVFMGFGLSALTNAFLAAQLATFACAIYFFKKTSYLFNLKSKMDRELIGYSLPIGIASILGIVFIWTDILMLGYFRNAVEVGIYNAAIPFACFLGLLPEAFSSLFLPTITKLYAQNNNMGISAIYNSVARWVFYLNLAFATLMILFSREIIYTFFGQPYSQAISPLIILTLGYFISSFIFIDTRILIMLKKTVFCLIFITILVICNITLNTYLIPRYGINGAATATAISLAIMTVSLRISVYRLTRVKLWDNSYFKAGIANLGGLGLLKILQPFIIKILPLYQICLGSSLFLGTYFLLLIFLKGVSQEDKNLFKGWKKMV